MGECLGESKKVPKRVRALGIREKEGERVSLRIRVQTWKCVNHPSPFG